MPPECPAKSAVTIQQVDENTWIIKRQLPERRFKMVLIPVVEKLPEDPGCEETEAALARSPPPGFPNGNEASAAYCPYSSGLGSSNGHVEH